MLFGLSQYIKRKGNVSEEGWRKNIQTQLKDEIRMGLRDITMVIRTRKEGKNIEMNELVEKKYWMNELVDVLMWKFLFLFENLGKIIISEF